MNSNPNMSTSSQLKLTEKEIDYLEWLCCINKKVVGSPYLTEVYQQLFF